MTVTVQSAGKFEDFFLEMAGLDPEPTSKEIENIFTENDMQVVGPPLKREQPYGLPSFYWEYTKNYET